MITEGSVLAVKQPCWTKLVGGGYHIRVDHPSDVVLLGPSVVDVLSSDALVPDDVVLAGASVVVPSSTVDVVVP